MGYYSTTLQKGSQGEETKKWQNFLKSQGYDLEVDGIFGDITDKWTRDYQQKNGLTVDGIVGANTWGKAGYSDINTPVSAPTIDPMPTAPTYDTSTWDESEKGSAALGAYNDAKDAVNNYGPFQYANEEQYKAVMDKILNREDFTYDFNGDALYQQYKDKYIKQGKMAMGDAIGQASAMTGGYGNSYAQSVGQQAYQAQLENLNDIIPQLYQMALDKYNMDGQELYNQFGMLGADYDRAYGQYQDGYDKLMDKLGIARGDYYDGGDMFYTEQDNKNAVAGQQFNDAMAIWEGNNTNAWRQAEWDETARQNALTEQWKQKEFDAMYGNTTVAPNGKTTVDSNTKLYSGTTPSGGNYNNGSLTTSQVKALQAALGVTADGYYGKKSQEAAGGLSATEAYAKYVTGNKDVDAEDDNTANAIPDSIRQKAATFKDNDALNDYLTRQRDAGHIDDEQMGQLYIEYEISALNKRDWQMVDDGGINWFWGLDGDIEVKDQYGNTFSLDGLIDAMVAAGFSKQEAKDYAWTLQEKFGAG